ncbi:MAG: short chain dehydrogenase [Rhodobacteraceae bacterium]|nr:MAG: short chain dehydrogenase [Paracoccaceae bacterium]
MGFKMNGSALITGAATRIGKEIALGLAAQGNNIVVHYLNSKKAAEQVACEAKLFGVRAECIKADLLDDFEVSELIFKASELIDSPLNILVNNASIFEYDSIETASTESWHRHIGSNLKAPLFLIQEFSKQVPDGKKDINGESIPQGNVVNIVDQRVLKKTPEFFTYSLAKMGLWSLTQTAAQALAPKIRVNAIGPGPTLQGHRQEKDHFKRQRKNTVLERGSTPREIVDALAFLLKTPSITGQLICIDGGQHLAWKTADILGLE